MRVEVSFFGVNQRKTKMTNMRAVPVKIDLLELLRDLQFDDRIYILHRAKERKQLKILGMTGCNDTIHIEVEDYPHED